QLLVNYFRNNPEGLFIFWYMTGDNDSSTGNVPRPTMQTGDNQERSGDSESSSQTPANPTLADSNQTGQTSANSTPANSNQTGMLNASGQTTTSTKPPAVFALTDVPKLEKSIKVPAPDKFYGKAGENIPDWFEACELYTYGSLWDDALRAKFIGAFLGGHALEVWKGQCSKSDYAKDKAIMTTAFETSQQSDQAYYRFMSYEWDRKIPLTVYSSILSRYLMEYNFTLPVEARLSTEARQALPVDKMTLLVSGPARAEIRKARPPSITSLCELLCRYVDDKSGNPAIGAVAPLTPTDVPDPTKDMMNKFAELIEGVQETQTRQMERVCAMLGTIAKDISTPAKAIVQPQPTSNPRQFRKIKRCGICSGPHWTMECNFKKFDKGCALCSDESHLARKLDVRPDCGDRSKDVLSLWTHGFDFLWHFGLSLQMEDEGVRVVCTRRPLTPVASAIPVTRNPTPTVLPYLALSSCASGSGADRPVLNRSAMTTSCTATTVSLTSTTEPEQAMVREVAGAEVSVLRDSAVQADLMTDRSVQTDPVHPPPRRADSVLPSDGDTALRRQGSLERRHGDVGDNLIDCSAAPEDWGDPEKNTVPLTEAPIRALHPPVARPSELSASVNSNELTDPALNPPVSYAPYDDPKVGHYTDFKPWPDADGFVEDDFADDDIGGNLDNYAIPKLPGPDDPVYVMPDIPTVEKPELKPVADLCDQFKELFRSKLGRCDLVEHPIITDDSKPVAQRPRRIPYHWQQDVRGQIDDMLKEGIIRPSRSSWRSPCVFVKKKTGAVRICVDFRVLNEKSDLCAYPLPRPDFVQDDLLGAKVFTTLDL
ncbi:hypothetical protein FOZ62_031256, partial [Perkinsus olseni]